MGWLEKEVCINKVCKLVYDVVLCVQQVFDVGKMLFVVGVDVVVLCELNLLIIKFFLYVFNVDEVVFIDLV